MLADRLRTETRVEHERVEAVFDITRPGVTPREVRGWVEAFYGFYVPFEAAVTRGLATADLAAFFDLRRKGRLLEADLRDLGRTGRSLHDLPVCDVLPDVSALPAILGALYVTEGSTLGGQVIARHLSAIPALPRLRFFAPYGDRAGAMWRGFRSVLDERVPAPSHDRAIRAARDTFTVLHDWLVRHKPLRQ